MAMLRRVKVFMASYCGWGCASYNPLCDACDATRNDN